ncbi:hypothetical protein NO932_11805 [Pelagibacterium sp. 26DY04]|uniref:hypothetical protein n=1 Tax=Pelagibacterium sp. 26DY04 TaxID=2967130 RepID=UPI0028168D16|nr:hypothetical protein [Pelagibacterium sp. 26DY04]WMT85613.1 hypothetical protein NO932_11805 [Pelagibacterium sp. 26DY04]
MRGKFTKGPYRAIGSAIYADHPQEVDPAVYRGFTEPEGERKYLIAESIPHKPTRDLLSAAPHLYDFVASLENDDGSLPAWVWEWRNRLLAYAHGETDEDPTPGRRSAS